MHARNTRGSNGSVEMLRRAGCVARHAVAIAAVVVGGATTEVAQVSAIDRVSVRSDGLQANGPSAAPAVSAFADCTAFATDATNLLPGRQDSNSATDVYVFDRRTQTVERVSVASDGSQANRASQTQGFRPGIDAACTCVAFSSDATNLVPDDTNHVTDVFVRDLVAQSTERVSLGAGGESNGPSSFSSVSADCGLVAFQSTASNLVSGDTNNTSDIFVSSRSGGGATRVNVAADGSEANGASITPSISADGRCVAFASAATNLLGSDTNGTMDVYVACDGVVTCRASVDSNGNQANGVNFLPGLSADGNLVVFKSLASNLVPGDLNTAADVFVHNCQTGETERVSVGNRGQQGNDNSFPGTISNDGRFVAFGSFASNLIVGLGTRSQAQIYVRDRENHTTVLISKNLAGRASNGSAPDVPPSITADGNFVAFASSASDLVIADTNGVQDAFSAGLPCDDPTDCPPGSECENGVCVPPATPTPTPTPECTADDQCPEGQVCSPDGHCVVATATPTPTPSPPCTNDNECPPGQICIEETGHCVTPRPPCDEDSDCSVACAEANDCADLASPPDRSCVDNQCCPADHCRSMRCVPVRGCEEAAECFGTEACIEDPAAQCNGAGPSGNCECGGDCNRDGAVFGNEISTAINILAGVAPLSVCRSADINGDGQVMGTEICLALSNLAQGCPDLLSPLSGFGQSRADEVVTYILGTMSGLPGQTVDVPIGVVGGNDEIVMAQIDLLYDSTTLAITNPASACRLDARLGSQVVRTSVPDSPAAPEGQRRLRIFVGDLVLPTDAFGDGPLVSCAFEIRSDAPGGVSSVVGDHLNVSDVRGNAFGTATTAGGVEIVLPTPEPTAIAVIEPTAPAPTVVEPEPTAVPTEVPTLAPPPPPAPTEPRAECAVGADCGSDRRRACVDAKCRCAGDCDGDGQTVVSELVKAVGVVIGETPLTACAAADANGNGVVTVDELLVSLGNLTRGCPQ